MKKKASLVYEEGDLFGVPLEDWGFGVGLIARRKPGRGNHEMFAYFWGHRFPEPPKPYDLLDITPRTAIAEWKFGDLGIIEGHWPILGTLPGFRREEWPLPTFGFVMPKSPSGTAYLRIYDDTDPAILLEEQLVNAAVAERFPRDGTAGDKALEYKLTVAIQDYEKHKMN